MNIEVFIYCLKPFNYIAITFEKKTTWSLFLFILSFLMGTVAHASPNTITFQSRIIKPDGTALEAAAVNFRFSITDTVGSCVIYQEDFNNRNMSGSKGLINLSMGAGSKVYPVAAMTLSEVFNNYNSPTLNCQAGGNIAAGATDRRKLIVQFNDGSGWQTVPAMDINSTPFALQADSALKLGDFPAADYVRTATFPTCVGGEALYFNGASFTCVAVGGGSGTVTSVTSANADIGVATTTTTPILTLNVGTGNNQIVKLNGSSQLPAVSGVNLTALNASNLGSGTVPATQMPALTGDVTMTAGTTATSIAANVIVDGDINASAGIARLKIATGTTNHVVINDGATGAMSSIGCANGQLIKWAGGAPTCSTDLAGVGDIINGGNATGATVSVGTTDAQSFALKTNNATAMTILSNGNVGVGTTTPFAPLTVMGNATTGYFYADRAATANPTVRGIQGEAYAGTGGLAPEVVGVYSKASAFSAAATNVYASYSEASMQGNSTSSITNAYGQFSLVNISAGIFSPTITNAYGVYSNITKSTGNITNGYGLYVGNVQATNKWSVYASDSAAQSYFAGNVGIGTTTTARLLHVAGPMRMTPTALPGSPAAGDLAVDSGDSNKFKYYDGSGWVIPGSGAGSVTSVTSANADIGVATTTTTPILTLNVGTGNNQIVKLNGTAELPAVSGVNLTALNASNLGSGAVPAARMPALTGDVTTVAGAVATSIAANAVTSAKILDDEIVNADINTSAAIARTKLASGTNDHVLINSGAGVMSSEAQLAVVRGGTGLSSYTNNALIMANGTGTALTNATCAPGELLLWSGTAWACANMAASANGFFKDGGNTFTATATIGTNSNHNLEFETNGTTKMTVLANGNVGVGITTPTAPLNIWGFQKIESNFSAFLSIANSSDTPSSGGILGLSHMRGTNAAPTQPQTGDVLGDLQFSNIFGFPSASIKTTASENFTATTRGATLSFSTTAIGANSPSNRMTILDSGNVGIGTNSPQTTLQVAGVISPATNNTYTLGNASYRFTEVYATNGVINTSDRREKKDIYNTDLGLDFINKLRPVSYRWNTGVDSDVHYGLIAQEAERVIAEVGKTEKTSIVTHDETTDRYGVRYSELISPLIKAVQELYSRILGIDREIASVKAQAEVEKAAKDKEIEKLKQENAAKAKEMAELNARLDKIEKAIKSK